MKIADLEKISENTLVVAIGDIHGCENLLDVLMTSICFQAMEYAFRPMFVFLGDIIDRGSRSCEALTCVADAVSRFAGSVLILGNHDEWLLRFMRNELTPQEYADWMANGGVETLRSYFGPISFTYRQLTALSKRVVSEFPDHFELLSNAYDIALFGDFAFVHAGIRPRVELQRQSSRDLRWIREEFLDSTALHGKCIVHGHTVTQSQFPERRANRIALDTGAVFTGRLSAGIFDLGDLVCVTYVERDKNGEFTVYRQFLDQS